MKQSFRILTCKPDQRSFRQEEFILEPTTPLNVEVDLPGEFITSTGTDFGITVTLEGLKWLANHFDAVFMGTNPRPQGDSEQFEEDDMDWEQFEQD